MPWQRSSKLFLCLSFLLLYSLTDANKVNEVRECIPEGSLCDSSNSATRSCCTGIDSCVSHPGYMGVFLCDSISFAGLINFDNAIEHDAEMVMINRRLPVTFAPTVSPDTPAPTVVITPEPTPAIVVTPAPVETVAPVAVIETPAPVAIIETPAPVAIIETPAPVAVAETPAPIAIGETTAPAAVITLEPTPAAIAVETPVPTEAPSAIDLSGISSSESYTLFFISSIYPQIATDFSTDAWTTGLETILGAYMTVDSYSVSIITIISKTVTTSRFIRMLQATAEYTIVKFALSEVLGSKVSDVSEFLISADTGPTLITAYNDAATAENVELMTATSITTYLEDYEPEGSDSSGGSSNVGVIVGVLIACLALFLVLGCMYMTRRKKRLNAASEDVPPLENSRAPDKWYQNADTLIAPISGPTPILNNSAAIASSTGATAHANDAIQGDYGGRVVGRIASGLNAIGVAVPLIGPMILICAQLVILFENYQDVEKNCEEVVRWSRAMESILRSLDSKCKAYPELQKEINTEAMELCAEKMRELLALANMHNSTNLLMKFALSRKTKSLMEDASKSFTVAVSTLQLNVASASLSVNMRIDQNVNSLLTAMDGIQVQLAKVLEEVTKDKKENPKKSPHRFPRFKEHHEDNDVEDLMRLSDGTQMDSQLMRQMTFSLNELEVQADDVIRIQAAPIGSGGFSKIYLVKYKGHVRAAKVVQLSGLSTEDVQKIYIKFSKELFILSRLQGPRVVSLHGCISTINEVSLILEYMKRGCLRTLIKAESDWKTLLPEQRFRIMLDAAEGMHFLHEKQVAHRDLKSANILITDDFRGKLTDFGLSKTTGAIATVSKSTFMGGTIAWLAPEGFDHLTGESLQADLYSFGIVMWEVFAGILGQERSIPWAGNTDPQIMKAVLSGERPELPSECINDSNLPHSEEAVKVMHRCLEGKPSDRPSFKDVIGFLSF